MKINKVIAFHGLPGAGKNTAAEHLQVHYNIPCFGFADALYAEVAEAYDIGEDMLRERATKETPLDDLAIIHCSDADFRDRVTHLGLTQANAVRSHAATRKDISFQPRSPRQILQLWGTEYRRASDPSYWIMRADTTFKLARMTVENDSGIVCIHDCRMQNEAEYIKRGGLYASGGQFTGRIIEITRPGCVSTGHVSDDPLRRAYIDYTVVNDSSVEALCHRIDDMIDKL